MEVPVNYLAVLIAAAANMGLGFLWYGPLFGKKWADLMGWGTLSAEKMKEKQKDATKGYAISFVGALLMAYALSHSLVFAMDYLGISGLPAGLQGGFWTWLGFVAPVTVGSVIWDGKPWMLWIINAGYYLVALLLMGAILSIWM